jgi:protein-disulfide isomerase
MTNSENHNHEHHKHHEHHEHHETAHKKKKGSAEKIRENPWMIFTIVLAILVVILLVTGGKTASCGKVISEEKAGQNLVGFLNQQTDGGVEYLSSEDLGSLYEITVTYQEQEIPVYTTKDGKYYLQGVIDLEEAQEEMENAGENTQTQQPVDVPKSDVPKVELFIMSHCSYGTQAEKGIIPAIELLGDKIDFELRFVYYAMHPSAGEVEEQLNEYCIQKEQEEKLIDYLKCFLEEGDGESCLTEVGINKAKLKTCTDAADKEFEITANLEDKSSWLSGYYPLFNIDKELNEQYGIGGSPTLVINGQQVSSARDPASYLNVICQAFTDGNVPEECDSELSTTAYSSGFGYTAGTSTTAQC